MVAWRAVPAARPCRRWSAYRLWREQPVVLLPEHGQGAPTLIRRRYSADLLPVLLFPTVSPPAALPRWASAAVLRP